MAKKVKIGLGDNSVLIKSGTSVVQNDVLANKTADFITSAAGSTVHVIANGQVGNDSFADFKTSDSLVTHKKIYDSNNDGYIWFGNNEVLDIDRTSRSNAGEDHLTFVGDMRGVRFLGSKLDAKGNDTKDYVYADAYVRLSLEKFLGHQVVEGTVGSDKFDASKGDVTFFYDNALGLTLGGDTITGFGKGDVLVTTASLFDSNASKSVGFGQNKVLDLSGGLNPTVTGSDVGAAGQIDFGANDAKSIKQVYFLGHEVIDVHGVATDYYFYGGSADTTYHA